jgi:hypothetical protein
VRTDHRPEEDAEVVVANVAKVPGFKKQIYRVILNDCDFFS